MEDRSEPSMFIEALTRWRESCVFYFKFDLALIAAVATIVSFFKVEGDAIIQAAAQYKIVLHYLIALLIYALMYELNVTNTCNRKDLMLLLNEEKKRAWMYRGFKWAYGLQVLAHVGLLAYALGFASGYVDSVTEHSACVGAAPSNALQRDGRCAAAPERGR